MSQATLNRSDGGKVSLVHRLKYALTLVTIEPMVLVQGVADYIAEVPEAQMVLYKTCRGRQRTVWTNHGAFHCSEGQFNTTAEFCANIEAHQDSAVYGEIEAESVSFNSIISWTENTVPILLALYIGSWSDRQTCKRAGEV